MSVKVADKIVQMNNQDYPLMDASVVEYRKSDGNTIRVDKCLDNKLDKEDGKSSLSATEFSANKGSPIGATGEYGERWWNRTPAAQYNSNFCLTNVNGLYYEWRADGGYFLCPALCL